MASAEYLGESRTCNNQTADNTEVNVSDDCLQRNPIQLTSDDLQIVQLYVETSAACQSRLCITWSTFLKKVFKACETEIKISDNITALA